MIGLGRTEPPAMRLARWSIAAVCAGFAVAALAVLSLQSASGAAGAVSRSLTTAASAPDDASRRAAAERARTLSKAELSLSPARSSAWARLAYGRTLEAGRLTPTAAADLLRSYELAPHDADLVLWRTAFVYSNWSAAPPALREAAFEEVSAFAAMDLHREALLKAPALVNDPSGRLALVLALQNRRRR